MLHEIGQLAALTLDPLIGFIPDGRSWSQVGAAAPLVDRLGEMARRH